MLTDSHKPEQDIFRYRQAFLQGLLPPALSTFLSKFSKFPFIPKMTRNFPRLRKFYQNWQRRLPLVNPESINTMQRRTCGSLRSRDRNPNRKRPSGNSRAAMVKFMHLNDSISKNCDKISTKFLLRVPQGWSKGTRPRIPAQTTKTSSQKSVNVSLVQKKNKHRRVESHAARLKSPSNDTKTKPRKIARTQFEDLARK